VHSKVWRSSACIPAYLMSSYPSSWLDPLCSAYIMINEARLISPHAIQLEILYFFANFKSKYFSFE
jgi:hypothetical protein